MVSDGFLMICVVEKHSYEQWLNWGSTESERLVKSWPDSDRHAGNALVSVFLNSALPNIHPIPTRHPHRISTNLERDCWIVEDQCTRAANAKQAVLTTAHAARISRSNTDFRDLTSAMRWIAEVPAYDKADTKAPRTSHC